jgi:hypothetical protein
LTRAVEETVEHAEAHPLPPPGAVGRGEEEVKLPFLRACLIRYNPQGLQKERSQIPNDEE